MPRLLTLILAAVLLGVSSPAPSQELPEEPEEVLSVRRARIGFTPLLGLRAPLVSQRRASVVLPGVVYPVVVVFDGQRDGGVVGGEVDLRLVGPLGLAGALAFTNPDDILTTIETDERTVTQTVLQGPTVVFARANLLYELPPPRPDSRDYRPAAFFMIGPALVREDYGDGVLALSEDGDRVENWALHLGLKALMPFGSQHLVLHLSVEDYATFWNPRDQERRRIERLLDLQPGTALSTAFDYNTTHIWMLNLGLSLRL